MPDEGGHVVSLDNSMKSVAILSGIILIRHYYGNLESIIALLRFVLHSEDIAAKQSPENKMNTTAQILNSAKELLIFIDQDLIDTCDRKQMVRTAQALFTIGHDYPATELAHYAEFGTLKTCANVHHIMKRVDAAIAELA